MTYHSATEMLTGSERNDRFEYLIATEPKKLLNNSWEWLYKQVKNRKSEFGFLKLDHINVAFFLEVLPATSVIFF